MRTATLLIVEDHQLLAQSLALALRAEGARVLVLCPRVLEEVVEVAVKTPVDLVLLDLDLGAPLGSTLPLVAPLVRRGSRVAVMTGVTDPARLGEALLAGAHGILPKTLTFAGLLAGVRTLLDGRSLPDPDARAALIAAAQRRNLRHERFAVLSARERSVLRDLVDGHPAEEIARRSHTSVTTVRTHIRGVLTKLAVGSQLAAVALARRHGWPGD